MISGLVVLDKPSGMTSFDCVESVQRIFGVRKAGHTGTLDPKVTGVLLILIGEARKIIKEGKIVIDRRIRKDPKFPVGLMDIVEIPDAQDYRITLFDKKGRITLVRIEKKFTKFKLCKIVDKSFVKGGKMQLHLHDGRNMLVENDIYKTKDTIVLNLDENKIENHFRYKSGSLVYIIGGSHVGEVARIRDIEIVRSPYPNKVNLGNSEKFETIEDYVFVIGDKSPFLDVFEVNK